MAVHLEVIPLYFYGSTDQFLHSFIALSFKLATWIVFQWAQVSWLEFDLIHPNPSGLL
jgi:hypothetical protein